MDITSMIATSSSRVKMNFRDFENIGVEFYDFYRTKVGYVYCLPCVLTQEQQEYILKFKNTKVTIAHLKYAPEIKKSLVLIADKCFRHQKEGKAK